LGCRNTGSLNCFKLFRKTKEPSHVISEGPEQVSHIVRVSDAEVQKLLTVKDLIGKFVVDDAGEKFGFVSDISFGTSIPTPTKVNDENAGPLDLPPSPDSKTQSPITLPRTYDTKKEQGSTQGHSIMDEIRLYAYISVGGFLGLGDDLVRVALSELVQDKEKDQLILNGISKSSIKAIAENGRLKYGNLDPLEQSLNNFPYPSESELNGEVTQQVVEALHENKMLPDEVAERITVTTQENNLVLAGNVDSFRLKNLVGRIATENTTLPIKNHIVVK
jgi:hypothetical protein